MIVMFPPCANDAIYDGPYGGKKVGKIDDDGMIYNRPYR